MVFDKNGRKSETFSLNYLPLKYVEQELREIKFNESRTRQLKWEDSLLKSKQDNNIPADVNAPLCPCLPSVKRSKSNRVGLWVEDEVTFI